MNTAEDVLGMLELLGRPRCVLVVEDQLSWLWALTTILEERGHTVVPMIGVLTVDATGIEGIGLDGKVISPRIPVADIHVVFLDYNFAGLKMNGASFMRDFRLHSTAPVMGMSSDRAFNTHMKESGATAAMQKSHLKQILLA